MTRQRIWADLLTAAALIRIGQDLGGDTPAARAIHALLSVLLSLPPPH